jgi:hypothetical protein
MAKLYKDMTPEQRKAANARKDRWRLKNKEKVAIYKKTHYLNNKNKYLTIERDRQYRKRYGITLDDYERMLQKQNGKCAICQAETAGKAGQCFAVDHCHVTLQVRGLLCIKCNARLGWYERHKSAVVDYLKGVKV